MKIQFIKSPTGQYNLAYSIGDVVDIKKELAEELIENKFAVKAGTRTAKGASVKRQTIKQ